MGVALFLMASSELPTAFIFSRLKRRFGSARLLCMSMAMSAVKALAFLLAGSLPLLLLAQPIQMLSYGLFTPSAVFFVNESVPEADRVKGQSLMMVASNGLGGVLGSALAGRVLDLGGVNAMLIFCITCCLIATGLSALAARKSPRPQEYT
jgi:PPP family 3-phenylpropionic acid transporter